MTAPTTTSANARPGRIDPATLQQWRTTSTAPRILDVRSPAEFSTMHIPGAYNVPLETLREHRGELVTHVEEDVVLVCHSGLRAEQAEQALAEVGMGNLHVLDGGIVAWQRGGGPVNRGRTRWDIERQVRLVAGSIVAASILGSTAVPALKWIAGGVGGGLAVAAMTNTCTMGAMLARLPFNRQPSCDASQLIAQLIGDDSAPGSI